MTLRDLITQRSNIGEVLKMMPTVERVDDEVIHHALDSKKDGQLLGERLVEMGCITLDQLGEALVLQRKMRELKDIEELATFFESVKDKERAALSALEFATPRSKVVG